MATTRDRLRRAKPLLGTFVEIAVANAAHDVMAAAVEDAFDAIARVHRCMSFHDPASDVSRLNQHAAAGAVTVDPWTFQVLEAAVELHRRSAGLFDVGIARVLQEAGLLPGPPYARPPSPLVYSADDPIELLPEHRIRFRDRNVAIDLGGIAKGFAVDRALDALREHGLPQGLVNAGGDLAVFGAEPESIFIRHPLDPDRLVCQVQLANEALASSGGRLDLFESSSVARQAIIDPRTQEPPRAIAGVSVRASSCLMADALTKVVMIQGEDSAALLDHYHASALVVLIAGDICVTPGWLGGETLAT
jgi:thiamine biosynthesis lipoprotein